MFDRPKRLIRTEAIIVAYAMSRLDRKLLEHRQWRSWKQAFEEVGQSLDVKATSIKNLRDEFDPFFENERKGWEGRPIRPNRQRVLGEFSDVCDYVLLQIVDGVLISDKQVRDDIVWPIARATQTSNAAERLRTGRQAERIFYKQSAEILGVPSGELVDRRDDACGFDFGQLGKSSIAIEVKGMRADSGKILFTDLEWRTADRMGEDYAVVVIGRVFEVPRWRVIRAPVRVFDAMPSVSRSIATTWGATVSVT